MPEDRPDWHLKKEISLAHILSTMGIVMCLLGGWVAITNRITVLETQQHEINSKLAAILENQTRIDASQDSAIIRVREETREDLRSINTKLDRLIERL